MAERSVFDPPKKESIVDRAFSTAKDVAGGVTTSVLGLGASAVDGTKVLYALARGATVSQALASATATRETFGAIHQATGLPMNEQQADSPVAFMIGQALSPTKGRGVAGTAARTTGNTAFNLGIDVAGKGIEALGGDSMMALPLAMIPGFGSRAGREALAARYTGKLDDVQIDRIKNGNITLGEITNDPRLIGLENRMRSNPETAGKFQQFEADRAARMEETIRQGATGQRLSPVQTATGAYKAYESVGDSLREARNLQATKDFGRVNQYIDPADRIIDSKPIISKIDEELTNRTKLTMTDENSKVIAGLNRLRDDLIDVKVEKKLVLDPRTQQMELKEIVTRTPKFLTTDEIRQQLSQWTGKTFSGDGIFDNISATESKKIAANMLNSYTQAIENTKKTATDPKVIDAMAALETARKNYATQSQRINAFTEREMSKYFGSIDNLANIQSNPQKTIDHLLTLPAEERRVAFDVIGQYKDPRNITAPNTFPDGADILKSLEKTHWDKMVAKGVIPGAAEGAPKFSIDAFLKNLDADGMKDAAFLADMIPDKARRAEFLKTLAEMRTINNRGSFGAISPESRNLATTAGLAAATGQRTVVAAEGANLLTKLKEAIIGPENLFDFLTNPKFKGRNLQEKAKNFVEAAGRVAVPSAQDASRVQRLTTEALQRPVPEGLDIPLDLLEQAPVEAPSGSGEGLDIPTELLQPAGPQSEGSWEEISARNREAQPDRDAQRRELLLQEYNNPQATPEEKAALARELGL